MRLHLQYTRTLQPLSHELGRTHPWAHTPCDNMLRKHDSAKPRHTTVHSATFVSCSAAAVPLAQLQHPPHNMPIDICTARWRGTLLLATVAVVVHCTASHILLLSQDHATTVVHGMHMTSPHSVLTLCKNLHKRTTEQHSRQAGK